MEKLKVGDAVYRESQERWGKNMFYDFATVFRLTNTRAVLSNGVVLVNEPKKWYDEAISFCEYKDRYSRWSLTTNEIIEKAKKEKRRQSINKWFDNKKFTEEEKVSVYSLFNPELP